MTQDAATPGATSREVVSRGFRLHYLDRGAGPALVLIPGLMQSAQRWVDHGYLDAFGGAFRVLALDPLGHGRSDKPHEASAYRYEDCATDVLAVLDAAGEREAHVWGYSRGGEIATAVAALAPDRVRSLVCGGALTGPKPPKLLADMREGDEALAALAAEGEWDTFRARLGMDRAAWERSLKAGQDPQAFVAMLLARSRPEQPPDLGGLHRPPLLYAGSLDPLVDVFTAHAEALGVGLELIEGRNHATAFEDCAAASGLVKAYVEAP